MEIPPLALIRQTAPQPVVADLATEMRRRWQGSPGVQRIKRGSRVAVAEGCLEVQGNLQHFPFDSVGNSAQETLFPHCTRARRRFVQQESR